jgi:hypothetical protein
MFDFLFGKNYSKDPKYKYSEAIKNAWDGEPDGATLFYCDVEPNNLWSRLRPMPCYEKPIVGVWSDGGIAGFWITGDRLYTIDIEENRNVILLDTITKVDFDLEVSYHEIFIHHDFEITPFQPTGGYDSTQNILSLLDLSVRTIKKHRNEF